MRIYCLSDLHLEFGSLATTNFPCGDVAILGGDITLLGPLEPHRTDARARALKKRTIAFLDQCRASFGRVFYLIGNHEAYDYDLDKAPALIREQLKGIELLDDAVADLGDNVLLVGGTLWTDMNDGQDAFIVGRGMNDFNCISVGDRTFTPQDAMARFVVTRDLIAATAKANPDKIIVVATHHAPSPHGLNKIHIRSQINHGYYTNLHGLIEAHPNIKYWCFGHTHIQTACRVAQCQLISNARGYIGHERSAYEFDPNCWFDPVTGEMELPFKTLEQIAEQRANALPTA